MNENTLAILLSVLTRTLYPSQNKKDRLRQTTYYHYTAFYQTENHIQTINLRRNSLIQFNKTNSISQIDTTQ